MSVSALRGLRYVPYAQLAGAPNVIVDGAATTGTVLCLSHWPGTPTPRSVQDDLSAQMVFRYLRHFDLHDGAALVSNNHFDQDGLVSVFAMVDPTAALAHEDLLTDLAAAGDFGTYRRRDAARASMAVAAFADPARSPLGSLGDDYGIATGALYEELLGRVVELVTSPEHFRELWSGEDACLTASERCIAEQATVEEVPDIDLAVVTVPEAGVPDAEGHRFGGAWVAGLHPMAVNNATERLAVLVVRGHRYDFRYRYETWVQLRSRPLHQRVDLASLAEELTALEADGAQWIADSPGSLTAGLSLTGAEESAVSPERFRDLLHVRAARLAGRGPGAGGDHGAGHRPVGGRPRAAGWRAVEHRSGRRGHGPDQGDGALPRLTALRRLPVDGRAPGS